MLLGSAILGTLGLIAGIVAEKFDQLSAFQNFIIAPLTFLSGVFYSIHTLPPFWQAASRVNPFFYMIDGFRYGFFGLSDVPPSMSLVIVGGSFLALTALTLALLTVQALRGQSVVQPDAPTLAAAITIAALAVVAAVIVIVRRPTPARDGVVVSA